MACKLKRRQIRVYVQCGLCESTEDKAYYECLCGRHVLCLPCYVAPTCAGVDYPDHTFQVQYVCAPKCTLCKKMPADTDCVYACNGCSGTNPNMFMCEPCAAVHVTTHAWNPKLYEMYILE